MSKEFLESPKFVPGSTAVLKCGNNTYIRLLPERGPIVQGIIHDETIMYYPLSNVAMFEDDIMEVDHPYYLELYLEFITCQTFTCLANVYGKDFLTMLSQAQSCSAIEQFVRMAVHQLTDNKDALKFNLLQFMRNNYRCVCMEKECFDTKPTFSLLDHTHVIANGLVNKRSVQLYCDLSRSIAVVSMKFPETLFDKELHLCKKQFLIAVFEAVTALACFESTNAGYVPYKPYYVPKVQCKDMAFCTVYDFSAKIEELISEEVREDTI